MSSLQRYKRKRLFVKLEHLLATVLMKKVQGLYMWIDSHAHLGDDALFIHWQDILQRAHLSGINAIVDICTDAKTLERGLFLQQSKPQVHVVLAAATTPHDVEKEGDAFFLEVEQAAAQKKLVAIGETGLDYHYEHSPKELQKKHLIKYFHLAKKEDLPIIFHCREAFLDLFAFADGEYQSSKALLHCFTGTISEARQVLDRGWSLSLSGIVTFKKSELLREIAEYVPLDRLFIETDAPYLAPQSKRGLCNEPSFVIETAQMIAKVKNVSLEAVAAQTSANARSLFSF
jgi:TatD DNase family protein